MEKYSDSEKLGAFFTLIFFLAPAAFFTGLLWLLVIVGVPYALYLVMRALAEEWELIKFTIANGGGKWNQ